MLERMFASVVSAPSPLDGAVSAFQELAATSPSAALIAEALRAADRLHAAALSMLARGGFDSSLGMRADLMLRTDAHRTFTSSRALASCAAVLPSLPRTSAALARGDLSFDQVRAVCTAARSVDPVSRARLDNIAVTPTDDADEVVANVEHEVARLRADLVRAREDRAIEQSFITVQSRLDGSGSFYGEADAASLATIISALDAVADRPVAPGADVPSRARQRFDALLAICEARLGGQSASDDATASTRPRPRLIATIDAADLAGGNGAARVLWSLAGRAPTLSTVATDTLLCDAEIQPVLFDGATPIDVGPVIRSTPNRLRTSLIARDGRCRFPGCRAPVAWTDSHHIVSPKRGGTTDARNCLLLCRRCHRAVHRFGWRISMQPDGTITFARRGKVLASAPHRPMRN